MSSRGAAAVVAGLLMVVGIVLGSVSHSINDGVVGTIDCGSPFSPSRDAEGADLGSAAAGVGTSYAAQCSSTLGTPRITAFTLIGVGLLALIFVGLTSMKTGPAVKRESLPSRPVDEG